jgi:signal transduction histidine kinase
VVKHAGVSRAVVRAAPARGGVEVTVRDHGSGFDTTVSHDGLGLARSIVERLRDSGGVAEIWSRPGEGTRVTLWVPR